MNIQKIAYWAATIILVATMSFSAGMYFTNTEMVRGFFEYFNYPTYIVIPLAIAKVLGIIMILTRYSSWLTEWAYAGFFFDLILAGAAHCFGGDSILTVAVGIVALFISYFLGKKIRPLS
jgi:hypothetical protein